MRHAIGQNNSIQTAIRKVSGADTSSTKLQINHPSRASTVVVVVEGCTDVSFYERFLDHTYVHEVAGVNSVEQVLGDIGADYPNLIGIRDADFTRVPPHCATLLEALFLTDGHDIEMMIARSDQAIKRFWNYLNGDSCTSHFPPNFSEIICRCLKPLSYFRLYNYRYQTSISFDEIDCQKRNGFSCYDHIGKIIKNPKNQDKVPSELQQLLLTDYSRDSTCIYELTRGHDFLRVAVLQARKSSGINISQRDAFREFYNSFDLEDFQSTDLCRELQAWCKSSVWCKAKGIQGIVKMIV